MLSKILILMPNFNNNYYYKRLLTKMLLIKLKER